MRIRQLGIAVFVIVSMFSCTPKKAKGTGSGRPVFTKEGFVSTKGTDRLAVVVLTSKDDEYELLPAQGREDIFSEIVSTAGERVRVSGELTGKGNFLPNAILVNDFSFVTDDPGVKILLGRMLEDGIIEDRFTGREYTLVFNGTLLGALKEDERAWVKGTALRENEIAVIKYGRVIPYFRIPAGK